MSKQTKAQVSAANNYREVLMMLALEQASDYDAAGVMYSICNHHDYKLKQEENNLAEQSAILDDPEATEFEIRRAERRAGAIKDSVENHRSKLMVAVQLHSEVKSPNAAPYKSKFGNKLA
jgi:hypothetical protein